jgi:hypothetical protein
MALVSVTGPGHIWPAYAAYPHLTYSNGLVLSNAVTLDATGEKTSFIGNMIWDDGGSHTVSSAGGKIHFRTGSAVTFADGSTTLDVGIQDVSTTTAPAQPDGSYDVKDTITGGDPELTSSSDAAWVTATMSTGTKTIANFQKVAIVFDLTARGGTDSLILAEVQGVGNMTNPTIATNLTGTWTIATPGRGIAVVESDDGHFGTLLGTLPIIANTARSFSDATNPDEEGFVFQVPTERKVNAVVLNIQTGNANADFDIHIYSDPFGTPTSVASASVEGAQGNSAARSPSFFPLDAEVTLSADTNYVLSVRATGSSAVTTVYDTIANASYRDLLGLTACGRTTRDGGTGAFAATTTTEFPLFGLIVNAYHDGSGGGGVVVSTGGGVAYMRKNVAGQKVSAQMLGTSGSAFTGAVTVYVTGDAGTQTLGEGSSPSGEATHEGNGLYTYTPTQAETNYDHIAFTFTGSSAVPVTVQVYTRVDANITYVNNTQVDGTGAQGDEWGPV